MLLLKKALPQLLPSLVPFLMHKERDAALFMFIICAFIFSIWISFLETLLKRIIYENTQLYI